MYPADQFNIVFTEDDLPDELTFYLYSDNELIGVETAEKNAAEYGIYWWPVEETSFALRHDGNIWGLYTQETPDIEDGFTNLDGQSCLIDDPDFTSLVVFEDNFEDTYTVLYTENESIPPVEVTVIRQSLCVWTSEVFEYNESLRTLSLEYSSNSLYGAENQNKWIIQNNFLLWVKNPYQNSPVGSYSSPSISTISVQ